MSNECFRDLKIGDTVWVYDHAAEDVKTGFVTSLRGGRYTHVDRNNLYGVFGDLNVEFCLAPSYYNSKNEPMDTKSFYVDFSEKRSRRGANWTGFMSQEDAEEFSVYLLQAKIEEHTQIIERLKAKI